MPGVPQVMGAGLYFAKGCILKDKSKGLCAQHEDVDYELTGVYNSMLLTDISPEH